MNPPDPASGGTLSPRAQRYGIQMLRVLTAAVQNLDPADFEDLAGWMVDVTAGVQAGIWDRVLGREDGS